MVEGRRPRGKSVRDAAAHDLARAGGQDARIEIVEYDPAWPARFDSERMRSRTAACQVPIDAPIAALIERGAYQYPEAFNATLSHRRWLCRPTAAHRTHHLHLVDEHTELERHLRFRDRLRASGPLRDEYATLKRELARRLGGDREAYSEAKSAFIRRVEAEAQDEE